MSLSRPFSLSPRARAEVLSVAGSQRLLISRLCYYLSSNGKVMNGWLGVLAERLRDRGVATGSTTTRWKKTHLQSFSKGGGGERRDESSLKAFYTARETWARNN